MRRVKVATVVVSYNSYSGGFFPKCLNHLEQVALKNESVEVEHRLFVIDNASKDQTAAKVRSSFSNITVIQTGSNLGYAGGNNLGFNKALEWGAEYVATVNHDAYVEPDWLLEALEAFQTDEQIGLVQPLILLANKPGKINSTGNQIHFLGYGYAGDYLLERAEYKNTEVVDVPYASGATFLMSSKMLRDVGNFDEEMWMYNEDEDLGWRGWLMGYRQVIAPKSIVHHQYEFSRSIKKMYYMDRNRLIVMFQNYHWLTLLLIKPVLLTNELVSFLFALKGGWYKEKLQTWKYFLRWVNWRLIFQKRRLRQQNRIVRERQVVKRFTGSIRFQDVSNPVVKYVANPALSAYWFVVKRIILW